MCTKNKKYRKSALPPQKKVIYGCEGFKYLFKLGIKYLYGHGILAFDRQVAGSSPRDGEWSL